MNKPAPESTDICGCGHEAIRHFWSERERGRCSLETCACKKFVLAKKGRKRCVTCGQWAKKTEKEMNKSVIDTND